MEYLHIDYAKARELFFVVPVTIFTIVLFFANTGVNWSSLLCLFVTVQLTTFITFHQRARHWRDSVDGIVKEIFVFLFKVGLKKKATKSQGLAMSERISYKNFSFYC